MSVSRFDRVRPRTTVAAEAGTAHDLEGKRALFSSTETEPSTPSRGAIEIACSRCERTTALAPMAALRLAFPALHLGVAVRRGERETMLGWLRRRFPSWLRCPACGHGSWVRVTVRV